MTEVERMQVKVALMGEGSVGKTSLVRRFVFDEYDDTYVETAGTKVSKIQLTVPHGPSTEVELELSIFDILGERGFRDTVKETYFHGCHGLVAVCDVTRKETLAAVHEWLSAATSVAGDVPSILLVNKMDLADRRRASGDDDIVRLARTWETPIAYVSAKTGQGVDDAFHTLAIMIVEEAFGGVQTRAVDQGLRDKVLGLLKARGGLGVTSAMFFEALREVSYNELERELSRLEGEGIVQISWKGPRDFTVVLMPSRERQARGG